MEMADFQLHLGTGLLTSCRRCYDGKKFMKGLIISTMLLKVNVILSVRKSSQVAVGSYSVLAKNNVVSLWLLQFRAAQTVGYLATDQRTLVA
jgi:hypothetical protein